MARTVVATAYGGPEVLSLVESALRPPGPGEVSVEVRAIGTNPADHKLFGGMMGADPSKLPRPVGSEAAGVVTAVGPDAVGRAGPVAVGDEVIAYRISGAYADAVTIPAASVTPKPPNLSWEAAAGLLLTGATGVHALTGAGVIADTRLLIHGVAGGVGLATAQIALADGATVVGTAAERHHEALRARGVVPVLYGEGLEARVREAAGPDGIEAAIDTAGTDEAINASLALVADRRRIVSVAAFQRQADGIRLIGGGGPGIDPGAEIRDAARLRLAALAGDGRLEVVVAATFPLAEAAAALELLAGGHAGGKVILVP